eukprot:3742653-Rhodomonas_salina.1
MSRCACSNLGDSFFSARLGTGVRVFVSDVARCSRSGLWYQAEVASVVMRHKLKVPCTYIAKSNTEKGARCLIKRGIRTPEHIPETVLTAIPEMPYCSFPGLQQLIA